MNPENQPNDDEQLELPLAEAAEQWRHELHEAPVQPSSSAGELDARCKQLLVSLTHAFETLQDYGRQARGAVLSDEAMPADYLSPYQLEGESARLYAAQALTEWYFNDDQQPTETTVHMAAIASSERTRRTLGQLNQAKTDFHDIVTALRQSVTSTSAERGELYRLLTFALGRRPKVLKDNYIGDMIRDILHPRLSLRQATRRVPVVDPMPASIRWRWVDERASDRVTRDELIELLEKHGDNPMAREDQRRLLGLPADEMLSIVKKSTTQLRLAITFPKGNRPNGPYQYLKNRMPVFYSGDDPITRLRKPEMVVVPSNAIKHTRRKRLQDEPFLSTLSVYRYRSSDMAHHEPTGAE